MVVGKLSYVVNNRKVLADKQMASSFKRIKRGKVKITQFVAFERTTIINSLKKYKYFKHSMVLTIYLSPLRSFFFFF